MKITKSVHFVIFLWILQILLPLIPLGFLKNALPFNITKPDWSECLSSLPVPCSPQFLYLSMYYPMVINLRGVLGNCGTTCTSSLFTRWNQVDQVTFSHLSWISSMIFKIASKGRTTLYLHGQPQPRWPYNLKSFTKVNSWKTSCPNGMLGRALNTCAWWRLTRDWQRHK